MKLHHKVALITGGSQGIGYSIADAYAREGADLLLVSRTESDLKNAHQKLIQAHSNQIHFCAADVSRSDDVARVAKTLSEKYGRVDILVNAAGIYGPMGKLESTDEHDWRRTFEVNVFGTMALCRLVIPFMKRQESGEIINFVGGGEGPFPRFTAYASSKGAIIRLTESLAAEVRESGIHVNAVAPGAVNTQLLDSALQAGPEVIGKEFYQRCLHQKESGGVSPAMAAELLIFLASGALNGISGRTLSAVWDNPKVLAKNADVIMSSDIYTFRRIKPNDRGVELTL